jgi:ribosomal protein S17
MKKVIYIAALAAVLSVFAGTSYADPLSTEEQTISGEIRNIDTGGNALTLATQDASGQPMEYKVVWDESNADVRDALQKHKVGDNITLTAQKNVVTQNWKATALVGPIKALAEGDIQTLTGEVKSVDTEKNFIVLNTTDKDGKPVERKIVWDNDFPHQAKLENARIGEHLSVRADENILSRNWKVKAIA